MNGLKPLRKNPKLRQVIFCLSVILFGSTGWASSGLFGSLHMHDSPEGVVFPGENKTYILRGLPSQTFSNLAWAPYNSLVSAAPFLIAKATFMSFAMLQLADYNKMLDLNRETNKLAVMWFLPNFLHFVIQTAGKVYDVKTQKDFTATGRSLCDRRQGKVIIDIHDDPFLAQNLMLEVSFDEQSSPSLRITSVSPDLEVDENLSDPWHRLLVRMSENDLVSLDVQLNWGNNNQLLLIAHQNESSAKRKYLITVDSALPWDLELLENWCPEKSSRQVHSVLQPDLLNFIADVISEKDQSSQLVINDLPGIQHFAGENASVWNLSKSGAQLLASDVGGDALSPGSLMLFSQQRPVSEILATAGSTEGIHQLRAHSRQVVYPKWQLDLIMAGVQVGINVLITHSTQTAIEHFAKGLSKITSLCTQSDDYSKTVLPYESTRTDLQLYSPSLSSVDTMPNGHSPLVGVGNEYTPAMIDQCSLWVEAGAQLVLKSMIDVFRPANDWYLGQMAMHMVPHVKRVRTQPRASSASPYAAEKTDTASMSQFTQQNIHVELVQQVSQLLSNRGPVNWIDVYRYSELHKAVPAGLFLDALAGHGGDSHAFITRLDRMIVESQSSSHPGDASKVILKALVNSAKNYQSVREKNSAMPPYALQDAASRIEQEIYTKNASLHESERITLDNSWQPFNYYDQVLLLNTPASIQAMAVPIFENIQIAESTFVERLADLYDWIRDELEEKQEAALSDKGSLEDLDLVKKFAEQNNRDPSSYSFLLVSTLLDTTKQLLKGTPIGEVWHGMAYTVLLHPDLLGGEGATAASQAKQLVTTRLSSVPASDPNGFVLSKIAIHVFQENLMTASGLSSTAVAYPPITSMRSSYPMELSSQPSSNLPVTGPSGASLQSPVPSSSSSGVIESADVVFSFKHHFELSELLQDIPNRDLINLGVALGLSYPKLKRISSSSLPSEMVAAWLRKEDRVIHIGKPSSKFLENALRKIGQTGIAVKVQQTAWK